MRVPARLPACDLPAHIGGMLFADGTVEVQCTPLGAVAAVDKGICGVLGNQSPMAPGRICVFGIVDEVVYFDEGGTDEGRARLVVALRAGLGREDRCEVWFHGGQALSCRALAAPAAGLVVAGARVCWDTRGYGYASCGGRTVVAAAGDRLLATAEAACLAPRHQAWTAEQRMRVATAKLAALRRQRERSGTWANAHDVEDCVRAARCWLCGDPWAAVSGGDYARCASYPLCGGQRPVLGAAPQPGARAFALELAPGSVQLSDPATYRLSQREDNHGAGAWLARGAAAVPAKGPW